MRICIPTDNDFGKDAEVYNHFGSALFYTIYDTESKTVETVDNMNTHHSHGMCNPLASLAQKKIDVVVCSGMGARAVAKLNESGIRAYIVAGETVGEIIENFENDNYAEITTDNACGGHGGCHGGGGCH